MRKAVIFIYLLMAILLAGCWDKVELEELGYVAAIGVDNGKEGSLSVTFEVQNPQVGSSDVAKAENEPPSEILTLEAADVLSAKDTVSANTARRIDFSHTKALIIGEEFARSPDSYHYLGELLRDNELRGSVNIIVCKEKASEFIRSNKPPLETRPMKFYDLMSKRWRESGITALASLHRFLQRTEQDTSIYLAIYGTTEKGEPKIFGNEDEYLAGQINLQSENPVQLIGSAVFKEGRMIGTLTGEETRLAMILRKDYPLSGIIGVFKDPLSSDYKISSMVYYPTAPKIEVDLSGDKPKIHETVFGKFEIISIPSHIDYVENLKNQELLKQTIKKSLEEKISKLIVRTQEEFKAEPFLWGSEVSKKFLTYEEFKNYDWMKRYPEAEIDVDYEVEIRGFGKELRPSRMKDIED